MLSRTAIIISSISLVFSVALIIILSSIFDSYIKPNTIYNKLIY